MHNDEHDKGLAHDLKTISAAMASRRQVLLWAAGASLLPVVGCGGEDATGSSTSSSTSGSTSASSSTGGSGCSTIPEETAGPYPGDGSNGPNVLTESAIVRGDIRPSFGALSGTAAGVPLSIKLTLVNANGACAPLAGYAIYLWHCDRDGNYSLYTVKDQNYLRGVQETDASGTVTFTSIFPACYSGRWPHIHFEIFSSLAEAMAAGKSLKTSQLALPEDVCNDVFATTGYSASVSNLSKISLASDNVFSDGSDQQVATVTGTVADGYVSTLTIAVGV